MIEITNNITGEVTLVPDPVVEDTPATEIMPEAAPEEKLVELQMQAAFLQSQIDALAAEITKGG